MLPDCLDDEVPSAPTDAGVVVVVVPFDFGLLGLALRFFSDERGTPPSLAWTVRSCRSNKSRLTKVLRHFAHLNGRSLVCERSWRLRCSLLLNARAQNWHLYFFSGAEPGAFFAPVDGEAGSTVMAAVAAGIIWRRRDGRRARGGREGARGGEEGVRGGTTAGVAAVVAAVHARDLTERCGGMVGEVVKHVVVYAFESWGVVTGRRSSRR